MNRGRWQLSVTQMLLLVVLCALAMGTLRASYLSSRTGRPMALAFSPDGNHLAAVFVGGQHMEGYIQVWDLTDESKRRPLPIGETMAWYSIDRPFSFPDNNTIVFAKSSPKGPRLVVWDIVQEKEIRSFDASGWFQCVPADHANLVAISDRNQTLVHVRQLATGQTLFTVPNPQYQRPQLAPNGEWLAVVHDYVNGMLVIYDARAGKQVAMIDAGQPVANAVFSFDGSRIITVTLKDGADSVVQVWEVPSGQRKQRFLLPSSYYVRLHVLPNENHLLVTSEVGESEVWDVTTGEPVARLGRGGSTSTAAAVSISGNTIATCGSDEIVIWDATTYERQDVLWRESFESWYIPIVVAFCAWAVIWGWVSLRLEADDPDQPGRAGPPRLGNDTQSGMEPTGVPIAQRSLTPRSLGLLVIGLSAIAIGGLVVIGGTSDEPWTPWRLALVVIGPPLLFVVCVAAVMSIVMTRTGFYRFRVPHARRVAETEGFLVLGENVRAWFAGPSLIAERLSEDIESTRAQFHDIFGSDEPSGGEVVLFAFNTRRQLCRFVGRSLSMAGVYLGWPAYQLVICERESILRLVEPHTTLRSLLGFHFLSVSGHFAMDWWLVHVLRDAIAAGEDTPVRIQHSHRRLRALQNHSGLDNLPDWFTVGRKELFTRLTDTDSADGLRRGQPFLDFTSSLCWYFLGHDAPVERREQFLAFVRSWTKRQRGEEAFRRHFGFGFAELLKQWQQWLNEQPVEGYLPVSPRLKDMLSGVWLPRVLDENSSIEDRRLAMYRIISAGSVSAAPALIQVVESGPPELREDACWALQSISGQDFAEDHDSWRKWWTNVSQVVDLCDQPAMEQTVAEQEVIVAGLAEAESTGKTKPNGESDGSTLMTVAQPQPSLFCWALIGIGGATAIALGVMINFAFYWWWPPTFFSAFVGVKAIVHVVHHRSRGAKKIAVLQTFNILNFDVLNFVFGILELLLLRRAKRKLAGKR